MVLVAFTAVVLLVQGLPLASYLRDVERDRLVTGLQRDAFTLAGRSEEVVQGQDPGEVASLAEPLSAYAAASGARVVVTDAGGIAIAASEPSDVGESFVNRPEIAEAIQGRTASGERVSETAGDTLVYVAVPIRSGDQVLGSVRVTYPAAEVDAVVDNQVRGLAIVGVITLLAAAGIALLIAGVVTGPLRRLRETSETIADGDLSARVDTETVGELRAVAQSFNAMAQRVESVVEAQRGFAGDASHQLRTPLTAMRLRVETALDSDDPGAIDRSLEGLRDDIDRMQRLIDGLLTLARADRDDVPRVDVDVADIVRSRILEWTPLAAERDVTLAAHLPVDMESTQVSAAPETVEQILDNYIDNAVEVAPPGSTITVGLSTPEGRVVVSVSDEGPGLSSADAAQAFDRFWRGSTERQGSGLGLAVAKALADAADASVALTSRSDGRSGTVAVVDLPAVNG
jgi:signal transduction histidine kinase